MILGGATYIPFLWLVPPITGTAAITLGNFTVSASGTSGSGLSGGFRLSQSTSFPLSDSLSIG